MSQRSKILCGLYLTLGLLGLILCLYQNVYYLPEGFVDGNIAFWKDTFVNPASRSITIDIWFLFFSVGTWMIIESRKLKMKGVYFYIMGALIFAVCFAFPLFLVHREVKLSKL